MTKNLRFESHSSLNWLLRINPKLDDVLKWLRPAVGQFVIEYDHGKRYFPDFVVETRTERLIIELKREDSKEDPTVETKARAAARWCHYASQVSAENGGKPWAYLLIPHQGFGPQSTFGALRAQYVRSIES